MTYLNLKTLLQSVIICSASMILIACGGGVAGDVNNFVVVDDQSVINLKEIEIAKVNIDRTVCVVIYDATGVLGEMKGDVVLGEKKMKIGRA